MSGNDIAGALNKLGLGLSRLLRYSCPGFLFVVIAAILNQPVTKLMLDTAAWYVVVPSIMVVGAAFYGIHRSLVIPIHHISLCLIFRICDMLRCVCKQDSYGPTRWLASHGIPFGRRISAYNVLRQSEIFAKSKDDINVSHAENGLVVMTSEVFLLGAAYAWANSRNLIFEPTYLFLLAAVVWIAAYPRAVIQHQIECGYFRGHQADVKATLSQYGFDFK